MGKLELHPVIKFSEFHNALPHIYDIIQAAPKRFRSVRDFHFSELIMVLLINEINSEIDSEMLSRTFTRLGKHE